MYFFGKSKFSVQRISNAISNARYKIKGGIFTKIYKIGKSTSVPNISDLPGHPDLQDLVEFYILFCWKIFDASNGLQKAVSY